MRQLLLLIGLVFTYNFTFAQITTSEVSVEATGEITSIDGKVGIGTDSPTSLLELSEPEDLGTASMLSIRNIGADYKQHWGPSIEFLSSIGLAKIVAFDERSGPNTTYRGGLLFKTRYHTAGGEFGYYERMRITSEGNVGIGLVNPSMKLQVAGSVATGAHNVMGLDHNEWFNFGNVSGYGFINWFSQANTTNDDFINTHATVKGASIRGGNGEIRFFTSAVNNGIGELSLMNERMSIESNGNVGIGTSNPSSTLDVIGAIRSDYLRVRATNANEGGEIQLKGPSGYNDWIVDNFKGRFRLHHSGASYFDVNQNGNVGIGTHSSGFKLDVNGSLNAKSLYNSGQLEWSDFVFEENYTLPSLAEVEDHISENGHLMDIPSEEEVLEEGYDLGGMDSKLLQKIEELTLYLIEQNKKIERLESEINKLKSE